MKSADQNIKERPDQLVGSSYLSLIGLISFLHLAKDKKQVEHLLYAGWEAPVKDLIGHALTANK